MTNTAGEFPSSSLPPKVVAAIEQIEQAQRTAEASGELVTLSVDAKVRRRFTRVGPLPDGGQYELTIRMEGGRPLIESLTVTPDPPVQHVTFSQSELVREALQYEALAMTAAWSEPGSVAQLVERASLAASRARYRRVTPERLREVLDQYEAAGIKNVMERQHTTERNARRLLARARKELQ